MISTGIEPMTYWLVAQCSTNYTNACPPNYTGVKRRGSNQSKEYLRFVQKKKHLSYHFYIRLLSQSKKSKELTFKILSLCD
jgi:hypothetical protein